MGRKRFFHPRGSLERRYSPSGSDHYSPPGTESNVTNKKGKNPIQRSNLCNLYKSHNQHPARAALQASCVKSYKTCLDSNSFNRA